MHNISKPSLQILGASKLKKQAEVELLVLGCIRANGSHWFGNRFFRCYGGLILRDDGRVWRLVGFRRPEYRRNDE